MPRNRRTLLGMGAAAGAVVILAVVLLVLRAQGPAPAGNTGSPGASASATPTRPTPGTGPPVPVSCTNNPATDTAALQDAVKKAQADDGSVVIAAGTCALNDRVLVASAVTIRGAGTTATSLVQQAHADIFGVSGDNVTIEDLHLDTATYNATPPDAKNPNPPVLYSTGNNTTVRNVVAEAGSGFGLRITGPNPCYKHSRGGAAVDHVTMTNTGTGGFASVDIDCQSHASLSNITVHGGIIALYRDSNVTLNGEQFTPGPRAERCAPPWFITSDVNGPSQNITVTDVTSSGGRGVVHGSVPNLVITNQNITSGCA